MGWVNYVVIPKWKVMIAISRNVDDDDFEFVEFNKLLDETEYDITEALYKKFTDLTAKEYAQIIRISDLAFKCFADFYLDMLLIWWLKMSKIEFEVISEHVYIDNQEKYKNYKILE